MEEPRKTYCIGFQIVIAFSFLTCSIFCFIMSITIFVIRHFVIASVFVFLCVIFAIVGSLLFVEARLATKKIEENRFMTARFRARQARVMLENLEQARLAIEQEELEANQQENNNLNSIDDSGIVQGSSGSESSNS